MNQHKKNKKLMISVMSILVAVLFINSAVASISIDYEQNNVEDEGISMPEPDVGEITLMATTQATLEEADFTSFSAIVDSYEYTSSPRITNDLWPEVYNNTWDVYENVGSSQDDASGLFSECADDFILEVAAYITTIHCIGGYWSSGTYGGFDWRIYFYDDDGTGEKPAEEAFAVYDFPNDVCNEVSLGGYYFDLVCTLEDIGEDPLFLPPETKYWIVLQGVGDIFPQCGFAMHTDPILLKESCFRSAYFGYPNWVPSSSAFGYQADHCFGLHGYTHVPDHDVAVKSINKPASGPAVPENPMQVTIKNWGNNTETFDAQMNIIRCEGTGEFLIYENFSGETFPPENWTTDYWEQTDTYEATGDPATAPEASVYYNDQYPNQNNYIMSPAINATGWEMVNLKFGFAADIINPCTVYLRYRKNDTSKWVDLTPWDNPISADFQDFFEIGCFGFGGDIGNGFQFKIEYIGYYYNYNYFYLDEVTLEACGGCAEYSEITEEPITLDAGEEIDVDFPGWVSTNWQDPESENSWIKYPIQAFTMLEGDENPWNDEKWKLVDIYYPWMDDVAPIDLSGPATGPAQTFNVGVTVKNVGQNPECCFKTHVAIAEIDYSNPHELFYDDFIDGNNYDIPGWSIQPPTSPYAWQCYPYYNYLYMVPGTAIPNLQLVWYYASPSACIRSDPFDTSTVGAMEMEWAMYYDHFTANYELYVEIRSGPDKPWAQIQPWDNPVTSNMAGDMYTCDATIGIGPETQIQFRTAGNYFNMNYWHLDNIKFIGYDMKEPEHEDEVCLEELDAGDEIDLDFGVWTPEFLAEETTGERNYIVRTWTNLEDPQDRNPGNDILQYPITLQFFHDVGVKEITNPNDIGRQEEWLHYDDGTCENALGLTAGGVIHEVIKLTPDELADYDGYEFTSVKVMHGWPGGTSQPAHDYTVWMYTGTTAPADPMVDATIVATGTCPAGNDWVYIDTDSYVFEPDDTVWIGVAWDQGAGEYPAGFDTNTNVPDKGGYIYSIATGWTQLHLVGYPGAWNLWAEVVVSGGAPPVKVYVAPGSQNINAIVENIGTFPELDLTCYAEIYEHITNCTNGTLVYEDSIIDIDLDEPLGGTETLNFDSYNFAIEGVYGLFFSLPDDDDDYPKNNNESLGIGCDDTPPGSDHSLEPATPDGENGWYVNDVEVTLNAGDPEIGCGTVGSGVNRIVYKIGSGSWQTIDQTEPGSPTLTGTFTIDVDADDLLIEYYAVDYVGNEESPHNSFTIDMDQTIPDIEEVKWEAYQDPPVTGKWYVKFTCNAIDATSGMDRVMMYINEGFHEEAVGSGPGYEFVIEWSETFKTVDFKWEHYDIAGWHTDDIIPGEDIVSYPYPHQQQQQQSLGWQQQSLGWQQQSLGWL